MGDPRRAAVFADFIASEWPDRELRIADVAGGHGALNAELYRLGYRRVVTFDKRKKRWTQRPHYHYGLFTVDAPRGFDLVVGMHPDDASDQIIGYAARRSVPFAVVPCCIRPSLWPYDGPWNRTAWADHLAARAQEHGFQVADTALAITGSARMLVGVPGSEGGGG